MDLMRQCMATQQGLPDSSRSGVSALDFCSASAAMGEDRKTSPIDQAVDWLTRKQAENPAATQAAMNSCRKGAGQSYGDLLNCMVDILGP